MTFRILIDANVFIYAVGANHPLKSPSIGVLELAATHEAFFTNAEVFQEVLHRHVSLRRWGPDVARDFYAQIELMQGRIESMVTDDVQRAARLAGEYPALSARDLIHVAIAVRAGATHIVSADTTFDELTEVARLDPMRIAEWRTAVTD